MDKEILYHYCDNMKAFNILQNRSIRLSDIRKSNDYLEMKLFFPDIFKVIFYEYLKAPFLLLYKQLEGKEALEALLVDVQNYYQYGFSDGFVSNFVICFSEEDDMLSQWRRYANDGQGICIGFEKEFIKKYVSINNDFFNFVKVKYVSQIDIVNIFKELAISALGELNS
jgi:hypothetical protein